MVSARRYFSRASLLGFVCIGLLTSVSAFAIEHEEEPAADTASTTTAATSKTTMFSQQVAGTLAATNAVMGRLAEMNVLSNGQTGLSSGDVPLGISVWANPFYTRSKDSNVSTGYKSDSFGAFFGGDYALGNDYTIGIMFGVDNTDVKSRVNGGGSDTVGLTVAPYLRYTIDRNYSVDATVGYTNSDSDNDRIAAGTRITGSSDTNRWFGSVGANGSYWHDRWNFLVRLGTTLSYDDRDGFRESNGTYVAGDSSTFGQAQIGGTAGYYFTNLRPWLSATYTYDYKRELPKVAANQFRPSDDRDQVVFGAGLTVFGLGAVVGDLNVKHSVGKEKYDNTTFGLTFSTSF